MLKNSSSLARALIPIVLEAGRLEMTYFRNGVAVSDKSDGSPVTVADREAEALITTALSTLAPGIPVVGEEAVSEGHIPDVSGGTFFLIDALDGTRGFVKGDEGFTVNVALVENFVPVMGLIHAPATGALYRAAGGKAFRGEEEIRARAAPPEGLVVLASPRVDSARLAAFLGGRGVQRIERVFSSLKFCVIAEGGGDLYPRLGPTNEWDTAAGEAILTAAGGRVTDLAGNPLRYGKAGFLNPDFTASGIYPAPPASGAEGEGGEGAASGGGP